MTEIDSYEKYCKSYTDDTNNGAKAEALLMLYIQNWIVKLQSNTEKEYTEAVQKVNVKMLNDFYNNLNNYAPTDNYVDLRDYEITDEEFKLLWRCQELLNEYDNNKQSLGSNCINIFGTLKDKYLSSFKEDEQ